MHDTIMSQFEITSGKFEKEVTHCGKFSAHVLLPASLQKKSCQINMNIYDKKGTQIGTFDRKEYKPAICGSSCHIKMDKDYLGKIVKGLITLNPKTK